MFLSAFNGSPVRPENSGRPVGIGRNGDIARRVEGSEGEKENACPNPFGQAFGEKKQHSFGMGLFVARVDCLSARQTSARASRRSVHEGKEATRPAILPDVGHIKRQIPFFKGNVCANLMAKPGFLAFGVSTRILYGLINSSIKGDFSARTRDHFLDTNCFENTAAHGRIFLQ